MMANTENPVNPLQDGANQMLDAALDHLRNTLAMQNTPSTVEQTLMSAFSTLPEPSIASMLPSKHKAHKVQQAHQTHGLREWIAQWLAPGIGLAASISTVAWIVFAPAPRPPAEFANEQAMSDESPFIALQSLERIALEPSPALFETRVPRMWLASYGVPLDPATATESVRAQMLVSAAGQPLALRFAQ